MHEYSLVQAVVERIEEEVQKQRALAVHALTVSVGELGGVDPELFRTAFETFRQGTVCEKAALTVRVVPATWSCPACGKAIEKGAVLRCPACDLPAKMGEGSDGLTLDRVELEVP
ncbi:hydrogenase maturation nickel metallochaperone HypA/HybF [Anaeromyxobacter paludicola]|uniref:Hydrogenase maturation factor HypA n=1 Tax=Anaeromyxobacter paludicola TaxID=2918171 RepID=A0ABM7XBE9_9BACT|nr:hydrogenase maturation nickel metallochaperone HypA [Anaeromyxobacter paludicola]BDG09168.1 putative hydrogenase nickel incorporation protein HypA [Anaeromyxobacter paludicola]